MKTVIKWMGLFLLIVAMTSCVDKMQDDVLKKVLGNLEKIESASYTSIIEVWQHGDTVALSTYCRLVDEYNNPADTTIGASFVLFDCDDPDTISLGYDGKVKVITYKEHRGILIDDFTTRSLPFRLVTPPFFNHAKNIIQYALTTGDSIQTELKELDDHFYFKLTIIEDEQIEFFGKAFHVENPYSWDTTSIYEMWISKSDDLPYKIRREMSHEITVETRMDTELNKLSINDFDLYSYFPADYEVRKYGDRSKESDKPTATDLMGKKAPYFKLNDMNEQPVSLDDYKSKVLLVNFTGIGCGPCQVSIPFLKKIKSEYSPEDFDIVSIETWRRKAHSLQTYTNEYGLNYKLLNATDEVIKDYRTGGVAPVFFILDKDRVVRKAISGYTPGKVDEEIEQVIKEFL